MPAGAEMEVARANRAVPPRIILDLSSICYTDRLGAGFGHGGANPNAKEKGLCTSAYHHHYIDPRSTPYHKRPHETTRDHTRLYEITRDHKTNFPLAPRPTVSFDTLTPGVFPSVY